MVGVFRRSLSFPNKNPNRPSGKPQLSHHIRSISLPCRSHPLISEIRAEINDLSAWASNSRPSPLSLSQGLTLLKETHETLQQILQLPQTQDSLRAHPLWLHNLLEDFLRFVDAYGMFQTSAMALREQHSSLQIAIRKRDQSKVVAYAKATKKTATGMDKLVSLLRCVGQQQQQQQQQQKHRALHAPLPGVVADVMNVTVSVSVALFNGIAAPFASKRLSWTQLVKLSRNGRIRKEHVGIEELGENNVVESLGNLKKKGEEEVRLVLKRMRDLEECISAIQSVTDKVFRALINSRVALLNILTLTH
ncbi:hypothetical protein Fmac_000192 [Flemingia macrophylla]|uniref:DUF241 domain protein n=1 Tax=Flemingia macrophylla TaxID=520843 RepID=A0ABD1NDK3_9FABA